MFAFLFGTVLAFAQTANGPLPEISGSYLINGSYEITTHIRSEKVHTQTAGGQQRLEDLRKDGYTCTAGAHSLWSCQKFLRGESRSPELDSHVQKKWLNQSFVIGRTNGELAEQTNNSDYLKEWTTQQNVSRLDDKGLVSEVWTSVDYDWVQGLWKIYLGSSREEHFYQFVYEQGRLRLPEIVNFEKGMISNRYMIEIQLEHSQP